MPKRTDIKMAGKTDAGKTEPLSRHYRSPEKEVWQFIEGHPSLLPPLCEAPEQIFSIFGRDTELKLELHKDPEEAYDELFVIIKTKRADAVELLEKLDKWFLRVAKDANNKLNFTVEGL